MDVKRGKQKASNATAVAPARKRTTAAQRLARLTGPGSSPQPDLELGADVDNDVLLAMWEARKRGFTWKQIGRALWPNRSLESAALSSAAAAKYRQLRVELLTSEERRAEEHRTIVATVASYERLQSIVAVAVEMNVTRQAISLRLARAREAGLMGAALSDIRRVRDQTRRRETPTTHEVRTFQAAQRRAERKIFIMASLEKMIVELGRMPSEGDLQASHLGRTIGGYLSRGGLRPATYLRALAKERGLRYGRQESHPYVGLSPRSAPYTQDDIRAIAEARLRGCSWRAIGRALWPHEPEPYCERRAGVLFRKRVEQFVAEKRNAPEDVADCLAP